MKKTYLTTSAAILRAADAGTGAAPVPAAAPAPAAPAAPGLGVELADFIKSEIEKALGVTSTAPASDAGDTAAEGTGVGAVIADDLEAIAADLVKRTAELVLPSIPGIGPVKVLVTDLVGLIEKMVAKL